MSLTAKQQIFIDEYLKTWNATEAARRAGYRGNENTLSTIGSQNLRKLNIAAVIEARLKESAMSADEVLMRLADQARGDIGDFSKVNFQEDLAKHPDSRLVRKLSVITNETASGGIQHRLQIELYDAQAALVHIGRAHGLFKDKVEQLTIDLGNLTDEQLRRIADGEHPTTVLADSSKSGDGA